MESVKEKERIASLDLLRGFALLGILLLNIIGFGLPAAAYSNPGYDLLSGSMLDVTTWATVEIFAEGAMRCLFSILFGAGVLLFTTGPGAKGAGLHYKRTFWLLIFGLFDAYILLWNGDILVTYALCGFFLYLLRNKSGKSLLMFATSLVVLISLFYGALGYGLSVAKDASFAVQKASEAPAGIIQASPDTKMMAAQWQDFIKDFVPTAEKVASELEQRRGSYQSAFSWNLVKSLEMHLMVVPVFLFWDALAMMLLGMALYKFEVLQGGRSISFYRNLAIVGFSIGLTFNGYEVYKGISKDFELTAIFAQMQATYHIGRLGMAMGYIGLLVLFAKTLNFTRIKTSMSAVGRMALTNYLMHSVICAIIFTGLGFGLVGELSRASLYLVVFAIWGFQLLLSPWWLKRYHFGPVEWLWRGLTYGRWPKISREI
ncbi:MAG: hypothetical protein ACJAVI_002309 [Candidatus Azotimanducaceae bacterium]